LPFSLVEINRRFRSDYCNNYGPDAGTASTSEKSINFYQTTRRNISGDSSDQTLRLQNLLSPQTTYSTKIMNWIRLDQESVQIWGVVNPVMDLPVS
jgi:hypothetical protein